MMNYGSLSVNLKNIFHSAILKLTLFYVLIVMVISVAFSIGLYNISSNEIENGLGRQTRVLRDIPITDFQNGIIIPNFDEVRLEQLAVSTNHLRDNLIYFNLLVLILSSVFSYLFAKKTLIPIQKAMESQRRFTADASHELRTPLTAMKTEIEVNLRDGRLGLSDSKKLLKSNLEEIEKLEDLSNSLLKLARYEDDVKPVFSEVSLEEIIVEAYEKVESLATKKSIDIKCRPELDSGSSKISVKGDKQSLAELFVILLDNAVKYSLEKSKIFITMKKDKKSATVTIKDQGIGIRATDLPHIFERFYRCDTSRCKEKAKGYGLGLSIAKRIVDLHDGTITVASKAGKGSEFTVKLG